MKGSIVSAPRNRIGLVINATALCFIFYFCLHLTAWYHAIFFAPVLLVDLCVSNGYNRSLLNFFKGFLLFQSLALWYLNTNNFFSTPVDDIREALVFRSLQWGDTGHRTDSRNDSSLIRIVTEDTVFHGTIFPVNLLQPLKIEQMDSAEANQHLVLGQQAEEDKVLNTTIAGCGTIFTDFPDLKYRSRKEVMNNFPVIFNELPKSGSFDNRFKNPCWWHTKGNDGLEGQAQLACLPYAYILGQPKSGTSDLFERLHHHDDIIMPSRKEVRWFTRGEFDRHRLSYEGGSLAAAMGGDATAGGGGGGGGGGNAQILEGVQRGGTKLLGLGSSIFSFTKSFRDISHVLSQTYEKLQNPSEEVKVHIPSRGKGKSRHKGGKAGHSFPAGGSPDQKEVLNASQALQSFISIDGGPHTLWWPTQSPDSSFLPSEIPPAQLLREIQPAARFIITVSDPVKRMYSDYYFLGDDLKPSRPGTSGKKSAQQFHDRVIKQIDQFKACVHQYSERLEKQLFLQDLQLENQKTGANVTLHQSLPIWFRSSQMCAHDRYHFAKGGWGRLAIGLYILFLEKWLEHFPIDQFLIVRLEDFSADPKSYMSRLFEFLGLDTPSDWGTILHDGHSNQHKYTRDPILPETETRLREFYRPYNELLAQLLKDDKFQWHLEVDEKTGHANTFRDALLLQQARSEDSAGAGADSRSHTTAPPPPMNQHHHHHHHEQQQQHKQREHGHDDTTAGEHPEDSINQHDGVHRHDHRGEDLEAGEEVGSDYPHREEYDSRDRSNPPDVPPVKHLRSSRHQDEEEIPIAFTPKGFSLENLTLPSANASTYDIEFRKQSDISRNLCEAAFGMDIPKLKYMLYDVGVPVEQKYVQYHAEASRNPFHCLTLLYSMADAHSRSHVFSLLKGRKSWLTDIFDPPMELKQSSVLSHDIVMALEKRMLQVAAWLHRAGVSAAVHDTHGWTPLHYASMGGEVGMVSFLLKAGANSSAMNEDQKAPLHFATALGHADVASILFHEGGADMYAEDLQGMRPIDLVVNPGPISAHDALTLFNITQRPARQIERILHPELHPAAARSGNHSGGMSLHTGWTAGDGGWGTHRLAGFEDDMNCDRIDQYWADEISSSDIMHKYLARNTPVLIRGLIDDWEVRNLYEHDILQSDHGDMTVQVSDIPYSEKFGGARHVDMTLGEYMQQVKDHRIQGGTHPWYVFKGNPVTRLSDRHDSLVKLENCPTPPVLQQAFEHFAPSMDRGKDGVNARKIFVNAQWALGGEGTGAPVHFHNTAWNALIYGAKKWIIYPPSRMIMSNKQILDYYETDMNNFTARGVPPITCVQTAGDVVIIPESWGHGVINIQESVAVATEVKTSLFRLKPTTKLFSRRGSFDNRDRRRNKRPPPRTKGADDTIPGPGGPGPAGDSASPTEGRDAHSGTSGDLHEGNAVTTNTDNGRSGWNLRGNE